MLIKIFYYDDEGNNLKKLTVKKKKKKSSYNIAVYSINVYHNFHIYK